MFFLTTWLASIGNRVGHFQTVRSGEGHSIEDMVVGVLGTVFWEKPEVIHILEHTAAKLRVENISPQEYIDISRGLRVIGWVNDSNEDETLPGGL